MLLRRDADRYTETTTAAGVDLALTPEQVGRCIRDVGVGFLFAQRHHSAMKHVAGFFCAPADARPEVREAADWVTPSAAGRGAARSPRARGRCPG